MRIIYVEPIFKSICKDVGDKVIVEKIPYMLGVGDIIIGDHVTISGLIVISFNVRLFEKQEFIVGSDTFIASFSNFAIARKISIGSNCYIGNNVVIRDNDGHPLDYLERRDSLPVHREDIKPVTVGDDVWIGRGAHVLKGVTIGDRSIIGAGSIVNADVPSDCIVAGNPAKIVKRL